MRLGELPPSGWARVWRGTAIVSLVSATASVAISQAIMLAISEGMNIQGCIAAFVLPLLLGTPMMFYHLTRAEQLRLANQKLEVLASTDWLTGCLNRRAFTAKVNARLQSGNSGPGALLSIDADNFKLINDQFGHDHGDEALQMIARSIRANVGEEDLVGRLGGEEFGVLLVNAEKAAVAEGTERIRSAINSLSVGRDGVTRQLSVSIGGFSYAGEALFSDLFRSADQRLYVAKRDGRNRVDIGHSVAAGPLSQVA